MLKSDKKSKVKITDNVYSKNTNIIKIFCIVLLMGSLIGSIVCNYMNKYYTTEISNYIGNFFESIGSKKSLFKYIENFIQEFKYYIVIWFIGFMPNYFIKQIYILFIIFIKGFFIGFTSVLIIMEYNMLSLVYIIKNYSLSSIIFIIISFYISYKALKFEKKYLEHYIKQLILIIIINLILNILF